MKIYAESVIRYKKISILLEKLLFNRLKFEGQNFYGYQSGSFWSSQPDCGRFDIVCR